MGIPQIIERLKDAQNGVTTGDLVEVIGQLTLAQDEIKVAIKKAKRDANDNHARLALL